MANYDLEDQGNGGYDVLTSKPSPKRIGYIVSKGVNAPYSAERGLKFLGLFATKGRAFRAVVIDFEQEKKTNGTPN